MIENVPAAWIQQWHSNKYEDIGSRCGKGWIDVARAWFKRAEAKIIAFKSLNKSWILEFGDYFVNDGYTKVPILSMNHDALFSLGDLYIYI